MISKYGQIAESKSLNKEIYSCFRYISNLDQYKFITKFKDLPHSEYGVMHTLHELILGSYLCKNGFTIEYERNIGKKQPDWSIVDKSHHVIGIIEAVTHHIDAETNLEIESKLHSGKITVGYRPDANDPNHNRLYNRIINKATNYKDLIIKLDVPYIVAVYIDYRAVIDIEETKECVEKGEEPLFKHCPYLSGVLHFEALNNKKYNFYYIENQYATRKIFIPSGYLEV